MKSAARWIQEQQYIKHGGRDIYVLWRPSDEPYVNTVVSLEQAMEAYAADAISRQREADAKVCETEAGRYEESAKTTTGLSQFADTNGAMACKVCAAAIRGQHGQ